MTRFDRLQAKADRLRHLQSRMGPLSDAYLSLELQLLGVYTQQATG